MHSSKQVWKSALLLAITTLVLSGCGSAPKVSNLAEPKAPNGPTGNVVVKVHLPTLGGATQAASVQAQARPTILGVKVTATYGKHTEITGAQLNGSTASVPVSGLAVGKWNFKVEAIDENGLTAYSGTKTGVQILPDATGTLDVTLQPESVKVTINVDLTNLTQNPSEDYLWPTVGKVSIDLVAHSSTGSTKTTTALATVNIDKTFATYVPTAYDAGTLLARVKVYDPTNTIILWQSDEQIQQLYPGDQPVVTFTAEQVKNNGNVEFDTPVKLVPDAPTNISATYANGTVKVELSNSPDREALTTASSWWGYAIRYRLETDMGKPFTTLTSNGSPVKIVNSADTFAILDAWRGEKVQIGLVAVANYGTVDVPSLVYGPMAEYTTVTVPVTDDAQ